MKSRRQRESKKAGYRTIPLNLSKGEVQVIRQAASLYKMTINEYIIFALKVGLRTDIDSGKLPADQFERPLFSSKEERAWRRSQKQKSASLGQQTRDTGVSKGSEANAEDNGSSTETLH
jgi:hypothetical protein